ncbi:uncharacterized protein HMPREF1541_03072 [Cyphellophora europaea CBS 101466]|uniref:DJ-1/PfpI domain-containing protein n=1 Tax=Cyphellophora europaea (strain CBS 101466) TaxID=1220924 RepID=W2RXF8_CYPE1|nr:uncharacterized protein HMPREF1541_03072 [Cyphellophora europaea CBS 101466]ETN41137.1 hypothetical protein HMPREF1541_03072 [Cyphellophora europaea CBS 101466]
MSPPTPPASSTLNIGVLFFDDVQLLDVAPIDLFAMCTKTYLQACDLPAPLVSRGLDVLNVYFIAQGVPEPPAFSSSSPSPGTSAVPTAPYPAPPATHLLPTTPGLNLSIALTHPLSSPLVAPGSLDILFVPGPNPKTVPSEAHNAFLRGHAAAPRTHILVVCTGIFAVGHSGILDGRECTGPRPLVDMKLRGMFPKAKWRDDRRWVVDRSQKGGVAGKGEEGGKQRGELWSTGGISNGMDMVAAYLKEKMSGELAELVCTFAEVEDRGQVYGQGKAMMGAGFGWLVLRSLWARLWGRESLKRA